MKRRPSPRMPKYRLHRSGQALAQIAGRYHYLGKHGTPESREKYNRLVAQWVQAGMPRARSGVEIQDTTTAASRDLAVADIVLDFLKFAKEHYRKDGQPTSELAAVQRAVGFVRDLYSRTPAHKFGPKALITCRSAMLAEDLARSSINAHTRRIRRMFRWATENELVPGSVYHALQAVRGLQRGRSGARETDPVFPVPEDHVAKVLPALSEPIQAMIQLQLLTGMRPGEAVQMRARDLETTTSTWAYRPASHKCEHFGRSRVIFLGPQAQEILRPFLRRGISRSLFSPQDAEQARNRTRRENRKSPMTPSQRKRRPMRHPKTAPGDCYTTMTYARAIARACKDLKVPHWTPNQLRHNAGTRFRKLHGIEAARVMLGHSSAATSEIYAEQDHDQAARIMSEIG